MMGRLPNRHSWEWIGGLQTFGIYVMRGKLITTKHFLRFAQNSNHEQDTVQKPFGPSPATMHLLDMAPEIFETILGSVSFVDLPYLLQTSKVVDVVPDLHANY